MAWSDRTREEIFPYEGGEALAQVTQRSCGTEKAPLLPKSIQDQTWDLLPTCLAASLGELPSNQLSEQDIALELQLSFALLLQKTHSTYRAKPVSGGAVMVPTSCSGQSSAAKGPEVTPGFEVPPQYQHRAMGTVLVPPATLRLIQAGRHCPPRPSGHTWAHVQPACAQVDKQRSGQISSGGRGPGHRGTAVMSALAANPNNPVVFFDVTIGGQAGDRGERPCPGRECGINGRVGTLSG
ncbi:hypothetical protein WISP_07599 [Willisornis vidua]|uniref:Uncharacterized protein n=1 Tax=Willisornis vidua TaxID=1566151 RepID=A0ABQ9DXR2_9PASS|nr:hypothetical protein WISP_07599 [Willisornis vidua]